MFCNKCGTELKSGEIVCPNCGNFVSESNSYVSSQINEQGRLEISSARTLGIVSIITGLLGIALVGWICGGIGLSRAKSWLFTNDTSLLYDARKAKSLNVAGIIISTVVFAIYFIIGIMTAIASFSMLGAI